MPSYIAPTKDMQFVLHDVLKASVQDIPGYDEMDRDFTGAVLEEAGRMASEVLHPLALGVLRALDGDPFDLSHQVALITGNEYIAVDTRKRPWRSCIQGNTIRRFNIQQHLDFIRGDKVHDADTKRVGICQGG